MKTEWAILNAQGVRAMPAFLSWIDAMKVIAKLHRLGMTATLRRITHV